MLTNVEIWHNLSHSEIDDLEKVDRKFIQMLFGVPRSVPYAALYLETGLLPVSVIIKVRRLNYLHTILRSDESGMLHNVFTIQWHFPCNGDWILLVKTDLRDFGIDCNLESIKSKSKEVFKKLVKVKAREYAFNQLLSKKGSYSKMKHLEYDDFRIQNYLVDNRLSIEEKKLVFKFRTRMCNFGKNFRAGRVVTSCPLCNLHLDCQFQFLHCHYVRKELEKNFGGLKNFTEMDLLNEKVDMELINILKFTMEWRN